MAEEDTRILARTLFQQMVGRGYSVNQIVTFSSELIGLLTSMLRERREPGAVDDTARIALKPTLFEE